MEWYFYCSDTIFWVQKEALVYLRLHAAICGIVQSHHSIARAYKQ